MSLIVEQMSVSLNSWGPMEGKQAQKTAEILSANVIAETALPAPSEESSQ